MKIIKKITAISILCVVVVPFIESTAFAEEPIILEKPLLIERNYDVFFDEDPYIADIKFETIFNEDPSDPYANDSGIQIELDGALTKDGRAALNWTPYLKPNFSMYKVVHDQIDKNPYYPKHGYLDYFENSSKTGYITGQVPEGNNYFRICVITTDNKRGCSNTVSLYVDPAAILEQNSNLEEKNQEVENVRPQLENVVSTQDRKNNVSESVRATSFQKATKFFVDNLGTIIGVVATIIAVSGFTFAAKSKKKSISKYINQIDDTYSEYKMKAKRCEAELYRLRDIIDEQLKTGKIDESAYQLLMGRIEGYMIDIQKQIVNEKFGGLPESLKNQMFQMMENGEINEHEFETIQKLVKRSELSASEQDSLIETISDFKKQDESMKKKSKSE
ncbi:hypothetical protein C0416_00155 [bacterium]|nr:hypothetical protein [bacterium]